MPALSSFRSTLNRAYTTKVARYMSITTTTHKNRPLDCER